MVFVTIFFSILKLCVKFPQSEKETKHNKLYVKTLSTIKIKCHHQPTQLLDWMTRFVYSVLLKSQWV